MVTDIVLEKIELYLKKNIQNLIGDFLKKNNGYDGLICNILTEFEEETSRYWDAKWTKENVHIEFKKGRSIWLDLVRYSEILLKINDEVKEETVTLFFIPNNTKTKIEKIVGMRTSNLIQKLRLTNSDAQFIINLSEKVPRSLNAQASLTVKDIQDIAYFVVNNE
ncbi:hypothetical protein BMS3Bbin03_01369 [bacterium BMS3Bbin03]|nr:hypothetical protein BMS3Bbin03_01369 [bacterium BMS3Bbin03]